MNQSQPCEARPHKQLEQPVYHIWNRGVDGRPIFLDDRDHLRFLSTLEHFNTAQQVWHDRGVIREARPHNDSLVAIVAHTELDNHFHIIAQEIVPGGITRFFHKIGTGYVMYFNKRHGRRGRLFENSFNHKPVDSDTYLQHLLAYVHLNVLDRYTKQWREGLLSDWEQAERELRRYPWSSARYYCNPINEDHLIHRAAVQQLFDHDVIEGHLSYIRSWIQRDARSFFPL